MRQYLMFLEVRWNFRSTTYFLTRAPLCTSVLACRKCYRFFGIVQTSFSCLSVSIQFLLNMDVNMILPSKYSGVCPFKYFWKCFMISIVDAPGNTCHMNCTSRAATSILLTNPCSFHTSSNIVAQLLDGSGFEDSKAENTRSFILINFAAASLSDVFLDHRNVLQSCSICMLYASLRSTLVVVRTVSNLASLVNFVSLPSF